MKSKNKIAMTMDELLIGTGWYEVQNDDEVYYRWMGKDKKATVHFDLPRSMEYRLNISIYASASERILTGLNLYADSSKLDIFLSNKDKPTFITAVIPPDYSKVDGEETILTFTVKETKKMADIAPDTDEKREVGLAVSSINIFPTRRALFRAQKYRDALPFDGLRYMHNNPAVRDSVRQGIYNSAYEYYKNCNKDCGDYAPDLYELFDECPGDLSDILSEDSVKSSQETEQQLMSEIELLRGIVFRQGDSIRSLAAKLKDK